MWWPEISRNPRTARICALGSREPIYVLAQRGQKNHKTYCCSKGKGYDRLYSNLSALRQTNFVVIGNHQRSEYKYPAQWLPLEVSRVYTSITHFESHVMLHCTGIFGYLEEIIIERDNLNGSLKCFPHPLYCNVFVVFVREMDWHAKCITPPSYWSGIIVHSFVHDRLKSLKLAGGKEVVVRIP